MFAITQHKYLMQIWNVLVSWPQRINIFSSSMDVKCECGCESFAEIKSKKVPGIF